MTEPRHPGDAADLDFIAGPPTDAEPTRVRDVLLVATSEAGRGEYAANPPPDDPPADLGPGLTLGAIGRDDAELIMNACMPRGHYFFAVRQFSTRYAFVHEPDLATLDERRYVWDPESTVLVAVILSRLIQDNAYSTEFAARIVDYADGQKQVIPAYTFEYRATYRMQPELRDWLTLPQAEELRSLLAAYWDAHEGFPARLRRTINLAESAVHQRFLERRLVFLVSALEALLNTDKAQVTRQFVDRTAMLADELAIAGVSKNFARQMYAARSQASHGTAVELFIASPQAEPDRTAESRRGAATAPERAAIEKMVRLETVLRAAIRRAIEDGTFRDVFAADEAIRNRWPVPTDAWWWTRLWGRLKTGARQLVTAFSARRSRSGRRP